MLTIFFLSTNDYTHHRQVLKVKVTKVKKCKNSCFQPSIGKVIHGQVKVKRSKFKFSRSRTKVCRLSSNVVGQGHRIQVKVVGRSFLHPYQILGGVTYGCFHLIWKIAFLARGEIKIW